MWNTISNLVLALVSYIVILALPIGLIAHLKGLRTQSRSTLVRVISNISLVLILGLITAIALVIFASITGNWFFLLMVIFLITFSLISVRKAHLTSYPRVRPISNIGLILMASGLFFFVITLILLHRPGPACYCPTGYVSDTDVSGLTIYTTWWRDQEIGPSTIVEVTILPTSSTSPTAEPGQKQASSQLIPVGTPDVPIAQAFGANYDVSAKADLNGSGFRVDPKEQPNQPLEQKEVRFVWTVSPLSTGEQVLHVSVTGDWHSKEGNEDFKFPLADHELYVDVTNPTPPTLPSGFWQAVLDALFLILTGVWIIFTKRREEKRFIAFLSQAIQAVADGQRDNASTVMTLSNRISRQETGKIPLITTEKPTSRINIYISCASTSRDEKMLKKLKTHLHLLVRQFGIDLYEKQRIPSGEDRKQVISLYISQAHLILLLLSPDFSEECYEELELIAREMTVRTVFLIPVLIRHTPPWKQTFLEGRQFLPRDGRPLVRHPDQDGAMSDIVEHIRQIIQQIRQDLGKEDL